MSKTSDVIFHFLGSITVFILFLLVFLSFINHPLDIQEAKFIVIIFLVFAILFYLYIKMVFIIMPKLKKLIIYLLLYCALTPFYYFVLIALVMIINGIPQIGGGG